MCIDCNLCFHSPMSSWASLQWNGDLLTFWWPSTSWSSGHLLLWHWLWTEWFYKWFYDKELCCCQWMECMPTCLQSLVKQTHIVYYNSFIVVNCGALINPSNGAVNTSSGTTYLQIAAYTCNTGYTLIGANTRTCGGDGNWTPDAPTCLRTQIIATSIVYFISSV